MSLAYARKTANTQLFTWKKKHTLHCLSGMRAISAICNFACVCGKYIELRNEQQQSSPATEYSPVQAKFYSSKRKYNNNDSYVCVIGKQITTKGHE